jgi:hypothetical protein
MSSISLFDGSPITEFDVLPASASGKRKREVARRGVFVGRICDVEIAAVLHQPLAAMVSERRGSNRRSI